MFFLLPGNCNPRFLRSTMYNVPCTSDMLKNSHIPFALTVSPFAKLQDDEVCTCIKHSDTFALKIKNKPVLSIGVY